MEVVFHEEADVDGCDGKKEVTLIVFHLLHQLPVSLHKPQNQLQGQYPAASEVRLWVLALEPKSEPLLA